MTYIGNKDLFAEIALGNVPGRTGVNKFGRNDASASNTAEVVWINGGTTYPFPTTVDVTHVWQAADVVAARGKSLHVHGLDTNWDLVEQTVVLDASDTTTAVALTTAMRRVYRVTWRDSIDLTSDVLVGNSGKTTTYAVVTAGINQTQMAIYTVPAGHSALITDYFGSTARTAAKDPTSTTFRLYSADRANNYYLRLRHEISTGTNGDADHLFMPYLKIEEKTDLLIIAECADNNGAVNGGFNLILVEN